MVSVVMVGTIMIASTNHAVRAPKPSPPVRSATNGRMITMPKKP